MSDEDDEMVVEPPSMDWLLTFADLISLLITFFVLLYSMKVVDVQKWDELRGSFSGVFSIREPIHKVNPNKDTAVEKIDPIRSDNLDYVQALLERSFNGNSTLSDISMYRNKTLDTLVLEWSTDTMFVDGTNELTSNGKAVMIKLGDILRHLDNRLVVAVHTSPMLEKSRKFPTNWEFTMLRSIAMAELLEKQGIEKNIVTTAMGDSRFSEIPDRFPIAERNKRARRVEIILHGAKEL